MKILPTLLICLMIDDSCGYSLEEANSTNLSETTVEDKSKLSSSTSEKNTKINYFTGVSGILIYILTCYVFISFDSLANIGFLPSDTELLNMLFSEQISNSLNSSNFLMFKELPLGKSHNLPNEVLESLSKKCIYNPLYCQNSTLYLNDENFKNLYLSLINGEKFTVEGLRKVYLSFYQSFHFIPPFSPKSFITQTPVCNHINLYAIDLMHAYLNYIGRTGNLEMIGSLKYILSTNDIYKQILEMSAHSNNATEKANICMNLTKKLIELSLPTWQTLDLLSPELLELYDELYKKN